MCSRMSSPGDSLSQESSSSIRHSWRSWGKGRKENKGESGPTPAWAWWCRQNRAETTPQTLSHLEGTELGFYTSLSHQLPWVKEGNSWALWLPREGAVVVKVNPLKKVPCGKSEESAGDAGCNRDLRGYVTCMAPRACCGTAPVVYGIWNLPSCHQPFIQQILLEIPLHAMSCAVSWTEMAHVKCV